MKTKLLLAALCALITIIGLASCEALQEHVALVDDRAADGTYLPLNQVKHPKTGSPAVAVGKFYLFEDGSMGVTVGYGPSGPVSAPRLMQSK